MVIRLIICSFFVNVFFVGYFKLSNYKFFFEWNVGLNILNFNGLIDFSLMYDIYFYNFIFWRILDS